MFLTQMFVLKYLYHYPFIFKFIMTLIFNNKYGKTYEYITRTKN